MTYSTVSLNCGTSLPSLQGLVGRPRGDHTGKKYGRWNTGGGHDTYFEMGRRGATACCIVVTWVPSLVRAGSCVQPATVTIHVLSKLFFVLPIQAVRLFSLPPRFPCSADPRYPHVDASIRKVAYIPKHHVCRRAINRTVSLMMPATGSALFLISCHICHNGV